MASRLVTINAPVGGYNSADPLPKMPDDDALELVNVFPENSSCKVRPGAKRLNAEEYTGYFSALHTLVGVDGTEHVIGYYKAGASYSKWYSITPEPWAISTVSAAVDCQDPVSANVMSNRIFLTDGKNTPIVWTGSGTVSNCTWTGPSDIKNLYGGCTYKSRIYFLETGTCALWYGGPGNLDSGALISFDVQSLLSKGGYPLAIKSLTSNSSGLEDLLAIITSEGEILLYQGDYPDSATWNLVAHYFTAPLIIETGAFNVGNDVIILTTIGLVSIRALIGAGGDINEGGIISSKINRKIISDIAAAQTANEPMTYFLACEHAQGNALYITARSSNTLYSIFTYVQNLSTGAWTEYVTQDSGQGYWPAILAMTIAGGKVIFSSDLDLKGGVFKFDNTTHVDDWTKLSEPVPMPIKIKIRHAPRAFNKDGRCHFRQVKPYLSIGAQTTLNLGMETDFENRTQPAIVLQSSNGYAGTWLGANGTGHYGNLRIEGDVRSYFEYVAADIMYSEMGAI